MGTIDISYLSLLTGLLLLIIPVFYLWKFKTGLLKEMCIRDRNSRIKTFRCRKLRIHRTSPGVVHFDGDPMQADENVNIELIQKGLRVIVPKETIVKDNANVLQKAQEYVNGIKMINEAIVDNITHKNQKIIRKLIRKD